VSEAEKLVESLADSESENGKAMAVKLREALDSLKEKAAVAKAKAKEQIDRTESSIKEHPWTAVGAAVGIGLSVGLLIGYLAARRGD
jgi:ElaB/YqjD/DUF883 family membrane-anchored ribosome-binding protein